MQENKHIKALSREREQEIGELAEFIAEEYSTVDYISPEKIAEANQITFSYGDYGDAFDGMIEHKCSKFHIYCNLNRVNRIDSPRARFTFCHELGHYYIDEHRQSLESGRTPAHPSRCEYESGNIVEREADYFASNLLMPAKRFLQFAKKVKIGFEGIHKIANNFGVSITSASIKYCSSNIASCAIIKWNVDGYAWKWLSAKTYKAQYRKTIELQNNLPIDSPTARALRGENSSEKGFFEAGTTASSWFPYIRQDSHKDIIFIEQAISSGRFGVLTFLYPESGDYDFEDDIK
ncbi:MAG: ImmA/IrrE family metallo-endopeptidase [Candidatus Jettenia caeni]|nr:MAG: ImmA/IrrE family metallo-endopeptidase [Candidatus Jettenia caeni]